MSGREHPPDGAHFIAVLPSADEYKLFDCILDLSFSGLNLKFYLQVSRTKLNKISKRLCHAGDTESLRKWHDSEETANGRKPPAPAKALVKRKYPGEYCRRRTAFHGRSFLKAALADTKEK